MELFGDLSMPLLFKHSLFNNRIICYWIKEISDIKIVLQAMNNFCDYVVFI